MIAFSRLVLFVLLYETPTFIASIGIFIVNGQVVRVQAVELPQTFFPVHGISDRLGIMFKMRI